MSEDKIKENKKIARSKKNAAANKKTKKSKVDETSVASSKTKSSQINDGVCCRCVSHKEKKCTCKKSESYGKYVARKHSCKCFKYV